MNRMPAEVKKEIELEIAHVFHARARDGRTHLTVSEQAVLQVRALIFDRTNRNQTLSDSIMPDETSEPETTEKKRALAVRDLKPKSDPKGGAAKGGKSDKITPRTAEVDFDWTLRS
jgi:hypothetical protein